MTIYVHNVSKILTFASRPSSPIICYKMCQKTWGERHVGTINCRWGKEWMPFSTKVFECEYLSSELTNIANRQAIELHTKELCGDFANRFSRLCKGFSNINPIFRSRLPSSSEECSSFGSSFRPTLYTCPEDALIPWQLRNRSVREESFCCRRLRIPHLSSCRWPGFPARRRVCRIAPWHRRLSSLVPNPPVGRGSRASTIGIPSGFQIRLNHLLQIQNIWCPNHWSIKSRVNIQENPTNSLIVVLYPSDLSVPTKFDHRRRVGLIEICAKLLIIALVRWGISRPSHLKI